MFAKHSLRLTIIIIIIFSSLEVPWNKRATMSPTKKINKRNVTQHINKGAATTAGRTLRSSIVVTPTSKGIAKKKRNISNLDENISKINMVSKIQYKFMYVECPYKLRVYLCIWVSYVQFHFGKNSNFGYIPKKGTNISSDKYKALVKNIEEDYTSGKSNTYPDNNFAEESEEEEEEEETEDENTDDEKMTEVSPQKKATPRDFKPTKKYHVMTSKSTGKKISNNEEEEEEEEEEQTEDTPKKRGRPSKQLITVNMDNNIKEEGKTAEDISKKRGRPPKDSCSLKDRKGKFANTQSNWAPIEHEEWDHYSSEEEEPIDPMTGYHPRTGYPWKNYVEVKTEKGEEGKYTSKTSKMHPKQEIPSTQNMQDNLALMKLQFEKDPPKNIKVHYETFTIYILEDPLGTGNYFCAVAVLLHTKTRQPSAFL